jgi:hypothetical protein
MNKVADDASMRIERVVIAGLKVPAADDAAMPGVEPDVAGSANAGAAGMSARVGAAHSARFTGFFTVKNFQNYFCCLNALRPRRVASLVTGLTG